MNRILASKWTKVVLFVLCLIPATRLAWGLSLALRGLPAGPLTANPVEFITHNTGDWTIRFLLITLAVTPLRFLLNRPQVTKFRRMLGLFAFFYGFLHFLTWAWLDKFWALMEMFSDVFKRPFITVGMIAFVVMIPLAITSTDGWVKRLGWVRWQKLHRIVYVSPLAGVVHYWWLVKSDVTWPEIYAAILAVLLGYRVYQWTKSAKPAPVRKPVVAS